MPIDQESLEVRSRVGAVVDTAALTVRQVVDRVRRVQEILETVMKVDVHYGIIPGTKKKTLFKPGADLIAMTFGMALEPAIVEQEVGDDEAEYRVRVVASNRATGELLGSAEGTCSTREKKYRWRRPVHPKEWEAADPARRRVYWDDEGNEYRQVRQEPADITNTILQMAVKRGSVAVVRTVSACSDMFAQDLDDLPEHLRETEEAPKVTPPAARQTMPEGVKAEASAAAERPAGPGPFVKITVAKLAARGTKKDGTPWQLFAIKTSGDEREWVTFSSSVFTVAKRALELGRDVFVAGNKDERGKWQIEELVEQKDAEAAK